MTIKAFIFDIGGTLVKTDDAIIESIKMALKKNNLDLVNQEGVINSFGKDMRTIVKTAVEFSYSGDNIENMIKKCYEDYKSIFPKEVSASFKVFPTVVQALKLLKAKGTKMAIVTGMENGEAKFVLEEVNLLQYFDAVVTRDKITNPRPNPEGLFLAMQNLGLKKTTTIIVSMLVTRLQTFKWRKMRK